MPPTPPQAALDACQGKKLGDACAFTLDGRENAGTCFSPFEGLPAACRPSWATEEGPDHQ